MTNINVLEAGMFQLHRSQLQKELGVLSFFLKPDFLDFIQNKGFHFDRMETKTTRKLISLLEWNDPGFKNITLGKTTVDLRVRDRIAFV